MENGSSGGPPMRGGGFRGRGGVFAMRNMVQIICTIFGIKVKFLLEAENLQ